MGKIGNEQWMNERKKWKCEKGEIIKVKEEEKSVRGSGWLFLAWPISQETFLWLGEP